MTPSSGTSTTTVYYQKVLSTRTSYIFLELVTQCICTRELASLGPHLLSSEKRKLRNRHFVFILANIQLEIMARNYRKISQQHCDDGKEPTKCDEVVMHVQFLQLLLCRLDRRYRFRRGRCCLGSFMLCGYEKGRLMNP